MALTIQDLVVELSDVSAEPLLEDWTWLLGPNTSPILASALGDLFFLDRADGSVHILSTGDASTTRVADGVEELRQLLRTPEFTEEHLVPGIVAELRNRGKWLGRRQVYSYRVPPILGGEYSVENLEPTDIEVHFALLGQIAGSTNGGANQ